MSRSTRPPDASELMPRAPQFRPPAGDWGETEMEEWRARVRRLAGAPRLGIDTGGTFTDFVLCEADRVAAWKAPSRPGDPGRPVQEALERLDKTGPVFLGTTVGTNAVLEGRGAAVALITTAGFEDLLDLRRQDRPSLYSLQAMSRPPLVPRSLRFGAGERLNADGSVDSALDSGRLRELVAWVGGSGAEAVAVLFLHACANDVHERAVAAALAEACPGLPVSLSSRVLPEYREYERLTTTVINAFIGPLFRRYVDGLGVGERPLAFSVSAGGVVPSRLAVEWPVRTLLSGPAAGVAAALELARSRSLGPLLTFDMGGTSTDAAWVDPAMADLPLTTAGQVGGWPVALPSVDLVTVGAGGGSIARLDAAGALVVGPESAGADPGPAACGRGTQPTITDAAVVLGILPADVPLSGGIHLDRTAAAAAVGRLAAAASRGLEEMAQAIVGVAMSRMERALRAASSARGRDPRQASLLAFGGAGGLFAAELGRRLGVGRVIIPPSPGVFSAWGTLVMPARLDWGRSLHLPAADLEGASPFAPFWREVGHFVPAMPHESGFHCSFGVRYPGQSHELLVPAEGSWEESFHAEHSRRHGYSREDVRPTITTLRLSARYRQASPVLLQAEPPEGHPGPSRPVWVGPEGPSITPVVERAGIPDTPTAGPMIVVEKGAAILVPPWAVARVARSGLLIIEPLEQQ